MARQSTAVRIFFTRPPPCRGFSATRSLALRLAGLRETSSSDALTGLPVTRRSSAFPPH